MSFRSRQRREPWLCWRQSLGSFISSRWSGVWVGLHIVHGDISRSVGADGSTESRPTNFPAMIFARATLCGAGPKQRDSFDCGIAEKAIGHATHHSDAVTFQGIECMSGLGNCPIHIRKRHTCEEAESAWMFAH